MLDMPPGEGYYRSRIPCPDDERVARVVRAFSESSPGRQAVFREAVDGVRAGLLLVFSERMAALAVRMESARPIVQGLVAASLAQEGDPREALAVPALHRRSAEILGAGHRAAVRRGRGPHRPLGRALAARRARRRGQPRGRRLRGGRRRRGLPLRARRRAPASTPVLNAASRRVGSRACSIRCWAGSVWNGLKSFLRRKYGPTYVPKSLVAAEPSPWRSPVTVAVLRARSDDA